MDLAEMVKNLSKNTNKRFVAITEDNLISARVVGNSIRFEDKGEYSYDSVPLGLKWEEEVEYLTFEEMLKKVTGDTSMYIMVKHPVVKGDIQPSTLVHMMEQLGGCCISKTLAEILLEGKWYITK